MTAKYNGYSKALIPACISVGAVTLSACSTPDFIKREANLSALPDAACVEETLKETPGIKEVYVSVNNKAGRMLTLKGLAPHDRYISYIYSANDIYSAYNVEGQLIFTATGLGELQFTNSRFWRFGLRGYPQDKIHATLTLMRLVEQRLAERCSIQELFEKVSEKCSRDIACH